MYPLFKLTNALTRPIYKVLSGFYDNESDVKNDFENAKESEQDLLP